MKQLLSCKPWQLFILLIGAPILMHFLIIAAVFANLNLRLLLIAVPAFTLGFLGLFLAWFYILGTSLFAKLPSTANLSLTRFKIALAFPVVYVFAVGLLVLWATLLNDNGGEPPIALFVGILPFHFLSMACIFYYLRFTAKALKTAELQMPVRFSEYLSELIMLWLFPIGIWVLQPRINKLFAATAES